MGHKRKQTAAATDDTMEIPASPGQTNSAVRGHRKMKAVLAAGAVASAVGATTAYRRRNAPGHHDRGTSQPTPPPATEAVAAPPHDTSNQYTRSNPQTAGHGS